MKMSYHSVHDPKCGVCKKHCKTLDSVREHLTGPLAKENCKKVFATNGCDICLSIFVGAEALTIHKKLCRLPPALYPDLMPTDLMNKDAEFDSDLSRLSLEINNDRGSKLIALDCEMVGGGSDGSLDLCARVCLIDEDENMIFHSYVKPQILVTDYRYDITGITEDHLEHANPLLQVKCNVEEILNNGEPPWRVRQEGGKASILVGHDLDHDLECLHLNYPEFLIRDTAKYRPLFKTNLCKQALKDLARTYLGYEIQAGNHNPYEDCVAALRLYKRMCSQTHQTESSEEPDDNFYKVHSKKNNIFDSLRMKELQELSPDALLAMSAPGYKCWCLDGRQAPES